VSKVLDPQNEELERFAQAMEVLRTMSSRSVGIINDDFITYIIDKLRGINAIDCGGSNNWRDCFEEVGVGEFAELVSNNILTTFALIAVRARGHIIVTPNPIPTIIMATSAGFVLLARDTEASECYAIINTPAVRRLMRTRPCEFALEF